MYSVLPVLLLVEDVSEVGTLFSTAVHDRLKVEPGAGEPIAAGVVVVPALLTGWVGWQKPSNPSPTSTPPTTERAGEVADSAES